MASEDSSAALPAHAAHPPHPSAKPGYGKRGAPGQHPNGPTDFAHLPRREASIATYLDRLPDGADISVKTLAKVLPDYGQCALRTALRHLSEAGHLRRITETLPSDGGSVRWVTRTYFSRTARDDAWWTAFSTGNAPTPDPAPPPPASPAPPSCPSAPPARSPQHRQPQHRPRTRAYDLLAALGRTEPRMTLSAVDCAALEPLAEEWLACGATPDQLRHALTAGLPSPVLHPGGLARDRLLRKMPPPTPEPDPASPPAAPPPLRIMECTICRAPGRPEALPGGICGPCRGESAPPRFSSQVVGEVRTRVQQLRAAARGAAHEPSTGLVP
ncbi:hypothetical protein [Streptomyces sp. NPDC101150]|uniref:hypothetical protein n=1 Tax=Streptomyces sp. NPDC101150 TaxID=3366114 RepID=UPI0037FEA016